jgi:hypothetical protein
VMGVEAGSRRGGVGFWGSIGSMLSSRSAAILLCSTFAVFVVEHSQCSSCL